MNSKGNDVVNAVMFQAEIRRIEKLLYRIASSLRDMKQFKPWMTRILMNQCKDQLRKRKKWSFYPLEDAAAQEVEPPEPDAPVLEAMRKLKPELSLIIMLHYVDGYSIQDVASSLGIPESTVKTRMRSARKQLSKTLLVEWEAEL